MLKLPRKISLYLRIARTKVLLRMRSLSAVVVVFVVVLICINAASDVNHLEKDQKAHKPKTLRSDRVAKLAELSTTTSQKYFKDALLRPILRVRDPGSEGNLAVQEHIRSHMNNLGWSVEEDSFEEDTPYGMKPFNNIIATQDPSAPRRLSLACHFDSKYFTDFEFIAATDSAVPCAMLLDLGLTMNQTLWKINPQRARAVSLQFIFFDGEEAFKQWTATDSIYGARHLANKYANTMRTLEREVTVSALKAMDVLVLLDLIGHKDVRFNSWFSNTHKLFERMQKIERKLGEAGHLEPNSMFANRKTNKYFASSFGAHSGIEDDHIPFLRAGVPVLHLISYPFPRVWHTRQDDESALDYDTIHNINKILRVFVAEYLHLSP